MSWTVLASFQSGVRAHKKERPVLAAVYRNTRLIANGVQPRSDVTERRAECAV